MASELFSVVALPHSVAADAKYHVSLFVSPRLTPDGPEGKLKEFTHFPHWANLVESDATIELFDQIGTIAAQPLLADVDPDLWDKVFPSGTPVRGQKNVDFSDRHWRTFRAGELHDSAKLLHLVAMFSDPTSPPAPSAHPLTRLMGQMGVGTMDRREYDESRITRILDARIGESGQSIALPELEGMVESQENPLMRLALQMHRARRFYERPESKRDYHEAPLKPPPKPAKLPKPEPDFHERCSLVGDHPALQRRLGLVVDLLADDPDRLKQSQWLSARIVPQGDVAACRTTRTRCQVAGSDLVTVPRADEWSQERLRIGDAELFELLDMDPDGSALKLDRYVWTIPRLLAIEQNGDPIHAAPTALRSLGFTVVRNKKAVETQERLDHQATLVSAVTGGGAPLLDTEDVVQGLRVEVWDDTAKAWFSLHARRIDAEVVNEGEVVSDLLEEGFIQGTNATETPGVDKSPVHVHESVFGWEGWSLSAAKPGMRIRHQDGDEIVEEQHANPDPATPLLVTSAVEDGTLPRLRYGRSYAFRAWSVNLAGSSRSHDIGKAPSPAAPAVAAVAASLANMPAKVPGELLIPTLRAETAAGILRRRFEVVAEPEEPAAFELPDLAGAGIERLVLGRLRARRAETLSRARARPDAAVDRASLVARAFGDAAVEEAHPFIADTAVRDPELLAHAISLPELVGVEPAELLDVITPLRPFLRWDPVQPPAVVTRHRFSAGESLRQLVLRSGVTQNLDTLEITVEPPASYAAGHAALGYRELSERHLAPPKTSQSEAELHGAFDEAIGSNDPQDHAKLLAVAIREAGTFFDQEVTRLDNPSQSDPQQGIALVADPTVPASTLKSLPLPTGKPPAPGQYVVHDTDALVLPYLPDVLARGVSFVFQEAGRDRIIAFPFGTEGFTARFLGDWPALKPFRLVLAGSDALSGELDEHVVRIGLPAGDVQRFRLASSLDRAELDLFGPWRSLPAVIRSNEDVAEAAADGWLWALTPFEEVTLVHAVPRPLEAPRPTAIVAMRPAEGATDAFLLGAVDVHGPSTEQLTAEAHWTDPIDDTSFPAPDEQSTQAIAFTTPIRESEDLAILYGSEDLQIPIPGAGPVWFHQAIQRLGDTRHHTIHYRFRAATRFREYFDAETLGPAPPEPGKPVDDGQSVVGPEITLSVPSSARPAAPAVHSVLPLFRWESGTEPEQPVATRRKRRAGVRIYLERPWYSSGEGELLGVLLAPGGNDTMPMRHPVSQWGADPVWLSGPVARRAMFLELDNLLRAFGVDDRPGDALPVVPPATLPLGAHGQQVTVLGYEPQYSAARELWYVDVAIDPASTFWPFVRLAVARYQPDSIPGCHLSAPVRCDFVQLTPERTTSVSRTDVRHVRVVVSGPIGVREPPLGTGVSLVERTPSIEDYNAWIRMHRVVVARLQRRDPQIPTDLGWETVATEELTVRGFGRSLFEAAWVGELEAPQDLPLRTPGDSADWRITVEEWERLKGDPEDLAEPSSPPIWEQRLIYADEIAL